MRYKEEKVKIESLRDAVRRGDLKEVQGLLKIMPCEVINAKDYWDCTLLHHASTEGHKEIVRELLSVMSFEAINAKNKGGRTALHEASTEGHGEIVKALLCVMSLEAINAKNKEGGTVLHEACFKGHTETAIALVEKGSFLEHDQDNAGKSILHAAVAGKSSEIIRKLVRKMSCCGISIRDKLGNTALHDAVKLDHLGVLTSLLHERRIDSKIQNMNGYTPLCLAVLYGSIEMVEELLKAKDGVEAADIRNGFGETPLSIACKIRSMRLVAKIVSKTLKLDRYTSVFINENVDEFLDSLAIENAEDPACYIKVIESIKCKINPEKVIEYFNTVSDRIMDPSLIEKYSRYRQTSTFSAICGKSTETIRTL